MYSKYQNSMKKGDRVVLTKDHIDSYGFLFKEGQIGTVLGVSVRGGVVTVDLDGYDADKKQYKTLFSDIAERLTSHRITPWVASVFSDNVKLLD
jgi:hypothetical protein